VIFVLDKPIVRVGIQLSLESIVSERGSETVTSVCKLFIFSDRVATFLVCRVFALIAPAGSLYPNSELYFHRGQYYSKTNCFKSGNLNIKQQFRRVVCLLFNCF
jgi:hypothetical protein